MQYKKLTGIVLKKQNYREADQIATLYTRELGKVRCLARSLRLSKSKLAGSFQDLSLVEFELTHSKGIPTLIGTKTVKSFNRLKTDLNKTAAAFYAVELVIKLTPDEQQNAQAFDLLQEFLSRLNTAEVDESETYSALNDFSLKFLTALGFSMQHAAGSFKLPDKWEQSSDQKSLKQVHKSIGKFVEYILERNMKSETFLTSV